VIDVIIVNYKSEHLLHRCVNSIYHAAGAQEINLVIQDNGSSRYLDILIKAFPEAKWVRNKKNLGFGRAINRGIQLGGAPYILILNPDTFLFENFFPTLLTYMEDHPDTGVVGPKIFYEDGSLQETARSFPNLLTGLFGRTSILTRWFPENPLTQHNLKTKTSDGKTPLEVDWVSGACMFVRREAVRQIGMMDERFFMYWEDADWCRRMWANRWKVVYLPAATLCHHGGKSSETRPLKSSLIFHTSSYRYYAKYASWLKSGLSAFVALALAMRFLLYTLIQNRMKSS
jgi:GT2 family glycosyltransferase